MENQKQQLPDGFVEVLPDWAISDKDDEKFINRVLPGLTEDGKKLRDKGRNYKWVFVGEITRDEALERLTLLGEGWSVPTPEDSIAGAMNGIKFQGPNLVDNSEGEWGYDLKNDFPNISFLHRASVCVFGFGLTTDTGDSVKYSVYFVKK